MLLLLLMNNICCVFFFFDLCCWRSQCWLKVAVYICVAVAIKCSPFCCSCSYCCSCLKLVNACANSKSNMTYDMIRIAPAVLLPLYQSLYLPLAWSISFLLLLLLLFCLLTRSCNLNERKIMRIILAYYHLPILLVYRLLLFVAVKCWSCLPTHLLFIY